MPPIFLILLGHAEINGLPIWTINFLGMLFLIGRIMHAYSLLKDEEYQTASNLVSYPKWRIRGMILTFIAIGSLAITILIQMAMVFVNHFLQ